MVVTAVAFDEMGEARVAMVEGKDLAVDQGPVATVALDHIADLG